MSNRQLNTLVLGASGLVGLHITELLLQNDNYKTVYAVSRKGIALTHPKLVQIKADFENIASQIDQLHVDHLFSCLGSTRKKTPNKEDYYQVDHDYPLLVASVLHKNGCEAIAIVSSIGANDQSNNFYLKLKGETERDLKNLGFEQIHIFQPSLIKGKRKESRPLEQISGGLFKIVDLLLVGKLKKYRSIMGETIAKAMIKAVTSGKKGINIYTTEKIKELA